MHPLVRSFFRKRQQALREGDLSAAVDCAVGVFRGTALWDDAFSVIARYTRLDLLTALMQDAFDDLLEAGAEIALENHNPDQGKPDPEPQTTRGAASARITDSATARLAAAIQEVCTWAVLERSATRVGDFLDLVEDEASIPATVVDVWRGLADIDPRRVAVEHNLEILRRNLFADTMVHEGDRIEIVNFVGGGAGTCPC